MVTRDFIYSGSEDALGVFFVNDIFVEQLHQLLDAAQLQRRAEKAREYSPPGDRLGDSAVGKPLSVEELLHQALVAGCRRLVEIGRVLLGKINAIRGEHASKLVQQMSSAPLRNIRLVDENKGGDSRRRQKMPQGLGMSGNAVRRVHDENGVILHR